MPTVRVTCPACSTVVVEAGELTILRNPQPQRSEYAFQCPECDAAVVQPLSDAMIPVMLGAGSRVIEVGGHDDRFLHPSLSGTITEMEISRFVAALDRPDWFAELAV